jgi:predicted amidohydrolase
MSAATLNVVGLQMDVVWENRPANYATAHRLLAENVPAENSLVVLPETFPTGFSLNPVSVVEPNDGPTLEFLRKLAAEFRVCVVGGAFRRDQAGQPRNQALAVAPDGTLLAEYSKMQPSWVGGEGRVVEAGSDPKIFEWQGITIAPYVCYDLRFPEVFRSAAAQWQPHLYLVLGNWAPARMHHWRRLLIARAIENQAYFVGINRVGSDPHDTYTGESIAVDFHGEILTELKDEEGLLRCSLNMDALATYRRQLPFLADMKRG